MRSFATENYCGADIKSGVHKCAPLLCRKTRFASGFLHDEVFAACYGNVSFSKIAALNERITAAVGGGASHAPGTPLIYHIKQSIAKKSARFSAKLSSRHNRGGASHAPGSPFIYHIKPSIAKKSARLSDKFHQGIISPRRLAADRKLTNWLPSVIARFVLPGLE